MSTFGGVAGAVCALQMLAGCAARTERELSAEQVPVREAEQQAFDADGPFVPVRMSIHPLTSVISGDGSVGGAIEVHLEFFDDAGHPVKSLAEVVVELYEESLGRGALSGGLQQVERWHVDLTDLQTNARAYDRVTRSYRITLRGVPAAGLGRRFVLAARCTTIAGRELGPVRYRLAE